MSLSLNMQKNRLINNILVRSVLTLSLMGSLGGCGILQKHQKMPLSAGYTTQSIKINYATTSTIKGDLAINSESVSAKELLTALAASKGFKLKIAEETDTLLNQTVDVHTQDETFESTFYKIAIPLNLHYYVDYVTNQVYVSKVGSYKLSMPTSVMSKLTTKYAMLNYIKLTRIQITQNSNISSFVLEGGTFDLNKLKLKMESILGTDMSLVNIESSPIRKDYK